MFNPFRRIFDFENLTFFSSDVTDVTVSYPLFTKLLLGSTFIFRTTRQSKGARDLPEYALDFLFKNIVQNDLI